MRKRTLFLVGAGVVVCLAIGAGIYAATRTASATPQYWAQAKATKATAACLQANSKLELSASTRSDVEMSALSYLIDVPAGTNVDVKLATYTPTSATGSDYYSEKYGTYNFAMTKSSDGWRVTEFTRCY